MSDRIPLEVCNPSLPNRFWLLIGQVLLVKVVFGEGNYLRHLDQPKYQ